MEQEFKVQWHSQWELTKKITKTIKKIENVKKKSA